MPGFGAIAGDVIGSAYERNPVKDKNFPLFTERSRFTDDTVMTVAVMEALINGGKAEGYVTSMRKWGRLYPDVGYGPKFREWLFSYHSSPYGSYGNGSAMRVSPVAWWYEDLEEAERAAEISASVTHNHPEGVKGARAVAAAIRLALMRKPKSEIKAYIEHRYGYDLSRRLFDIRPGYSFDSTCQGSVPEAIIAFLESRNFEDAIRNAVSLGGDGDTLAAVAGSVAEAAYANDAASASGISREITSRVGERLDDRIRDTISAFAAALGERRR